MGLVDGTLLPLNVSSIYVIFWSQYKVIVFFLNLILQYGDQSRRGKTAPQLPQYQKFQKQIQLHTPHYWALVEIF